MELSELEAIVAEDPDAIEPYLVYADHLQEQGDPRGELITLDLLRMESPHDPMRVRAIGKHLDRHRAELLGPIVPLTACLSGVYWRLGFIKQATLRHPRNTRPAELADWVQVLLDAPAGRFIQDLTIAPLLSGNYTEVMYALAKERRFSLESLRLGPGRGPSALDMTRCYSAFPNLRALSLSASTCRLGTIVLPKLEVLDLWVTELQEHNGRSIAGADWPSLRALSVSVRAGQEVFGRLLAAELPALQSLRLTSYFNVVDLAAPLAEHAAARQLESLTFENTTAGEVMQLANAATRFERLATLVISSEDADYGMLEPFWSRGVNVTLRQPSFDFDPWEERTEVEVDEDEENATVFVDVDDPNTYLDPDSMPDPLPVWYEDTEESRAGGDDL